MLWAEGAVGHAGVKLSSPETRWITRSARTSHSSSELRAHAQLWTLKDRAPDAPRRGGGGASVQDLPRLGILPTMRPRSVFKQSCYWAFALLLFAVRSADAHVHLCLDGQEPPASVHVADGGVHHGGSGELQAHNDRDVKYALEGVFKKGESGDDLLLLSAIWSLAGLLAPSTAEPPQYTASLPAFATRSHLRPPLRGPPR